MSRNKFMHPRNSFKRPPNYTEFAIKYPKFRKICKLTLDGRVTLNMKDENTLRILSEILLKDEFGLTINFPKNYLVPTVPLRINYVLWLEDIMESCHITNEVCGIDIGCGASCIYSILCAKKNEWTMYAMDISAETISHAMQNICQNNLSEKITLYQQRRKEIIFEDFFKDIDKNFHFCLCNPPFFDNKVNYTKRKITCKESKNAVTGSKDELSYTGGEYSFVTRLIAESKKFHNRIKVFTTMIGCKTNAVAIIQSLKDSGLKNFTSTEFCQGNVTRWGVAWSYFDNLAITTTPACGLKI